MHKKIRLFLLFFISLLISVFLTANVAAIDYDGAGNAVEDKGTAQDFDVEGDLFYTYSLGNKIKGKIGGDLIAFGSDIFVEAQIGGNLRSASYNLTTKNTTAKNATVAAALKVEIDKDSKFKSVYALTSGAFIFHGSCEYLKVEATDVYIYGEITNGADIYADNVYFAESCKIDTAEVESINKPLYFEDTPQENKPYTDNQTLSNKINYTKTPSVIEQNFANLAYRLPTSIILALLLCVLLNKPLDEAASMFKSKPGRVVGLGFVGAFLIPLSIFFLILIGFTSSAGLVLGLGYLLIAVIANTFTAASLIRVIIPKINRYLSSAIGVTAVLLLSIIPMFEVLFMLFSLIYTFGYTLSKLFIKKPDLPELTPDTFQL